LQWFAAHSRVEENKYFVQLWQNRVLKGGEFVSDLLEREVSRFKETGESEILSAVVLKNGVFVTDSENATPVCCILNSQTE